MQEDAAFQWTPADLHRLVNTPLPTCLLPAACDPPRYRLPGKPCHSQDHPGRGTPARLLSPLWIIVFAATSAAGTAGGADWPQWGGHDDRNMVSEETGLPDVFVPGEKKADGSGIDLATTRNVKWVARLGSQTYGNPTVADGRLLVGTNDFSIGDSKYHTTRGGLVKCLDAATGKLLWKLVIPRLETADPSFNFDNLDLGICSSPTIDRTTSTWSPTVATSCAWTSTGWPTATTGRSGRKATTRSDPASRR